MTDWKKYLIVFFITLGIFAMAFFLSDYLNSRKLNQMENIYQQISTNILSTETKFSLLRIASCKDTVSDTSFEDELTYELNGMAKRVKYMESQLGVDDPNVVLIKTQYSLLQIKDYLLMRELATRCKEKMSTILYFHDLDCADCRKQSLVLDKISLLYPNIRVYWLDRNLQTPAMQTMISMFSVTNTPSIVIEEKIYSGFKSVDEIKEIIPDLKKIDVQKAKLELEQEKSSTSTKSE